MSSWILPGLLVFAPLTAAAAPPADERSETTSVAMADTTTDIDIVFTSPGCIGETRTRMQLLDPLFEHFRATPSALRFEGLQLSPQRRGNVIIFPIDAKDTGAVKAFFAASGDVVREIIADDLAVFEDEREVQLQFPQRNQTQWWEIIRRASPGIPIRRGRLVLVRRGQATLRALELNDAVAFAPEGDGDPFDAAGWYFQPSFAALLHHADEEVRFFGFGKRLGEEGRTVADLRALVEESTRGGRHSAPLVVHPGNVLDQNTWIKGRIDRHRVESCTEVLQRASVDVAGIRFAELMQPLDELMAFAKKAQITFVAANLTTSDGKRLPGHVLRTMDGKSVAVIGLVGEQDLARLPASVRSRWKLEPGVEAVVRVLREVREERPAPPDLVVVLTSARDEELRALRAEPGIDVILGSFGGAQVVASRESIELARPVPATQERTASVVIEHAGPSIGRIRAQIGDRGLLGFHVDERPVLQEGPVDGPTRSAMRPAEDLLHEAQSVLLPDAATLLALDDDVRRAVVGPRIVAYRQVQPVTEREAHYTDGLWLRLVNHALIDSVDADVAFAESLPRGDRVMGPVVTGSVESWLPDSQSVVVIDVDGATLGAAIAAAAALESDEAPPEKRIAVAGANAAARTVGGRPLDPRRRYRVVATDAAIANAALHGVLGALPQRTTFRSGDGGPDRYVVDDAGEPLRLRQVVIDRLTRLAATGYDDAGRRRLVDELLRDRSSIVRPELRLNVEELAADGSAYQNTPNNLALFGATRETRSTTPDLYTIGLRLRGSLVYDHPGFALELGSRVVWNSVFINVPDVVVPPQEQADDAQGWTELRLNNLRLVLGDGGFGVVPFIRAAVDTELTPTPLPTDPARTLPRQLLLPESVGLVANPGGFVREIRFGAVVQQDLSALTVGETDVNLDAGVVAGLRLAVPLGPLVLQSDNDLRYLVPDGDDRPADLALRLTSTWKLVLPVSDKTNLFVFADAFVVSGKTPFNDELAGSVVVGAGGGFSDLFAWR